MRKTFPGYYRPTEQEFQLLWDNCLFVLDANVLLNLYRYSQATSKELIDIMSQISGRLWVPHQAAFEYHKQRLDVIVQQLEAYEKIQRMVNNFKDGLSSLRSHPFIDIDVLLKFLEMPFVDFEKELLKLKEKHPDLINEDNLKDSITTLLDGKVGEPYSDDKLETIYMDGQKRYNKKIPPGYKDEEKDNDNKYGDLIIWFQIIDKAKVSKKPIIFITDDRKDDWWLRFKGKTLGPRPELVHEMRLKADVPFYMYQAYPFMEHAQKYLKRQIQKEAIEEVRDFMRHDEEYLEAEKEIVYRAMLEPSIAKIGEFGRLLQESASFNLGISEAFKIQEIHNALAERIKDFEKVSMPLSLAAIFAIKDLEKALMPQSMKVSLQMMESLEKQLKETFKRFQEVAHNIEGAAKTLGGTYLLRPKKSIQKATKVEGPPPEANGSEPEKKY